MHFYLKHDMSHDWATTIAAFQQHTYKGAKWAIARGSNLESCKTKKEVEGEKLRKTKGKIYVL